MADRRDRNKFNKSSSRANANRKRPSRSTGTSALGEGIDRRRSLRSGRRRANGLGKGQLGADSLGTPFASGSAVDKGRSGRPSNRDFFRRQENIHNDVKTTYRSKREVRAGGDGPRRRPFTFGLNRLAVALVSAAVILLFVYYAFVLFDLQVLKHDEMSGLANRQYYRKITMPPKRGDILDRNGKVLATTTHTFRIGITPKHVYSLIDSQTKQEITKQMASILGLSEQKLADQLKEEDKSYIQVAKDVAEDKANLLDQYLSVNRIGGVRLDAEAKRVYLNGDVGSQVIGFASSDGGILAGRLGIEYQLNDVLSGRSGFSYGARDNYLNSGILPFSESTELPTDDGNHVVLTLDYEIQKNLQDHVKNAVDALSAKDGGLGLVLNVKTGEVLAMASYPYFASSDPTAKPEGIDFPGKWDPTQQKTVDFLMENVWRNKAISDVFEVGSTFKTITLAMGLEENVTSEDKVYSDAPIDVLDYTIKCWSEVGHGNESLADAFMLSCNPPFVQVGLALGIERFYNYVEAFGFRQLSGIQLPGEAINIFHDNPSLIDLATLAFGEQSGFNLMSYAKGLSAVANGGNLMTPSIIKQVRRPDQAVLESFQPQIERRVISEKTSERVNKLLSRNNVMQGVNKVGAGYQLGGKTSTSVNEFTDELTMSYVSFAPIDNPEIMVIIVAKNTGDNTFGSNSLINNVSGLVDWVLDHMSVERNYTSDQVVNMQKTITLENVVGKTLAQAKNEKGYQSIEIVAGVDGMKPDDVINNIMPAEGTQVHYGSRVYVYPQYEIKEDLVPVPDFTGKNYSECMITAKQAGLVLEFEGDYTGLAVDQSVKAIKDDGDQLAEDPAAQGQVELDPLTGLPLENTEAGGHGEAGVGGGSGREKPYGQASSRQNYLQRGSLVTVVLRPNE